jgi:hypothetical protein
MATFYVLPAPGFLAQVYERHLHVLFPGLRWNGETVAHIVTHVSQAAASHPDIYLVRQHELAENTDVVQALVDAFGAEIGDEVIEMHAGPRLGEWRVRRRVVKRAA